MLPLLRRRRTWAVRCFHPSGSDSRLLRPEISVSLPGARPRPISPPPPAPFAPASPRPRSDRSTLSRQAPTRGRGAPRPPAGFLPFGASSPTDPTLAYRRAAPSAPPSRSPRGAGGVTRSPRRRARAVRPAPTPSHHPGPSAAPPVRPPPAPTDPRRCHHPTTSPQHHDRGAPRLSPDPPPRATRARRVRSTPPPPARCVASALRRARRAAPRRAGSLRCTRSASLAWRLPPVRHTPTSPNTHLHVQAVRACSRPSSSPWTS